MDWEPPPGRLIPLSPVAVAGIILTTLYMERTLQIGSSDETDSPSCTETGNRRGSTPRSASQAPALGTGGPNILKYCSCLAAHRRCAASPSGLAGGVHFL